jgi:hypothetical protein
MEDLLPGITCKVDVPARTFLSRMEKIALQTKAFKVELHENIPGYEGFQSLAIEPKAKPVHKDLAGQMIVDPDLPERVVKVEISASRWNPDPPTYEAYAQAARGLFYPLLREYNKQHKDKVFMRLQTRAQLEPKLPTEAQKVFSKFVVCANKSRLHPLDWGRFYDFVWHCHGHNVKLAEQDVQRLLVAAGFTEKKASHIADVFEHGLTLLKCKGGSKYGLR